VAALCCLSRRAGRHPAFLEGKKQEKIKETINLQGGSIGGIAPPHPEVLGDIRCFERGNMQQKKLKKQSTSEEAVMVALRHHIWKNRDASCVLRKNNQPVVSGLHFCFVFSCSKATECHCYHCQMQSHGPVRSTNSTQPWPYRADNSCLFLSRPYGDMSLIPGPCVTNIYTMTMALSTFPITAKQCKQCMKLATNYPPKSKRQYSPDLSSNSLINLPSSSANGSHKLPSI